jgi:hypothetical protein
MPTILTQKDIDTGYDPWPDVDEAIDEEEEAWWYVFEFDALRKLHLLKAAWSLVRPTDA